MGYRHGGGSSRSELDIYIYIYIYIYLFIFPREAFRNCASKLMWPGSFQQGRVVLIRLQFHALN
jgi:hypothetical protein